jgi:biotin-dependent carboxylase-like uncharacterized protein
MLEVLEPGPEATVQDGGRTGFGHLGVPRAGAVDLPSLDLGNRILGNPPLTAAVELLLGGAAFHARSQCLVALTGASAPVWIDARPVSFNVPLLLRVGQELRIGRSTHGLRIYLGVRGGIETTPYLGSRSTDTLSGVGPQPLNKGDILPVGHADPAGSPRGLDFHAGPTPAIQGMAEIAFHWGPRHDLFSPSTRADFTAQTWQLSAEASRVGVRLLGRPLTTASQGDLPTEGLHVGSIQVPPSGLPLVFLANSPPTGGYPVIGVVRRSDLPQLGQLLPGSRMRFRAATRSRVPDARRD